MVRLGPKLNILFLLSMLCAFSAEAQSNQVIDAVLGQPQAKTAELAYLALVGGGWIDESASPNEALAIAQAKGWIPKKTTADAPMDLATFSALAMRGLRYDGGLGWILFHAKRYAARELIARGIANASGGLDRILSGEEALRMLGKMTSAGEADQ